MRRPALILVLLSSFCDASSLSARHGTRQREAGLGAVAVSVAEPRRGLKRALIVTAAVLVDRLDFSLGAMDGAGGENFRKAVIAFQQAQTLRPTGTLHADT